MFVWYSCAEMCFAHSADVESDCDPYSPDSAFRTARWHSRGWTLQELIASFLVTFVTRDWKTIWPILSDTTTQLFGHGVKCRFPILDSDGFTIAVLLCDTGHEHLGLLLLPSNDRVQNPSRRKYHVGYGFQDRHSKFRVFCHLVSLGNDFYSLTLPFEKTVTAEWQHIFVVDSPPPTKKDVAQSLFFLLHSLDPHHLSAFRTGSSAG